MNAMAKNTCCQDVVNLEDRTTEHSNGRPDLTVLVCRVCGARHFTLRVDPGQIGLKGALLGTS